MCKRSSVGDHSDRHSGRHERAIRELEAFLGAESAGANVVGGGAGCGGQHDRGAGRGQRPEGTMALLEVGGDLQRFAIDRVLDDARVSQLRLVEGGVAVAETAFLRQKNRFRTTAVYLQDRNGLAKMIVSFVPRRTK